MEQSTEAQRFDLFLYRIGVTLLGLAFLGFWMLGPTTDSSVFGSNLYFDANQNIIFISLGVVSLIMARWADDLWRRVTGWVLGIAGLAGAAYSIYAMGMTMPNAQVLNIEAPLETLLLLGLGLWSLWIVLMPAGPVFIRDEAR